MSNRRHTNERHVGNKQQKADKHLNMTLKNSQFQKKSHACKRNNKVALATLYVFYVPNYKKTRNCINILKNTNIK